MFDIPSELKKLPKKPGVYIMKGENGKIIYVGKAVNLYNRVRQYFQASSAQDSPKVYFMAPQIREFEYIVVDSEMEALILENNLIKKHTPRFNIKLKDDKAYPYIKVTVNEHFPMFFLARRHEKDHARYFGPYIGGNAVRETLEILHRLWPIRTCFRKFPRDIGKERPCLKYHIGQCLAPCTGNVSEEEYGAIVEEAMQFLSGKYEGVTQKLEAQMLEAAENLEFERAAELRDKVKTIRMLSEKQKLDGEPGDDQDIAALVMKDGEALVQVFFIRGGKMIGREHFTLSGEDVESLSGSVSKEEIMTEFVKRFYGEAAFIPKEIILECDVTAAEKEVVVKWLSGLKGQNVAITVPKRGEKLKLVQMAANNAALTLEKFGEHLKREQERTEGAVAEIARALGLIDGRITEAKISRIEAYDISNIQGFESVASMVVFENGKPKNSDYRKFRIKGVLGPDDYASMEEVIGRRFARYRLENQDAAGRERVVADCGSMGADAAGGTTLALRGTTPALRGTPPEEGNLLSLPSDEGEAPSFPSDEGEAPSFPSGEGEERSFPSDEGEEPSFPSDESEAPSFPSDESEAPSLLSDESEAPSFPSNEGEASSFPSIGGVARSSGVVTAPAAKSSFSKLPDIIFMDGGKGQVSAAEKAMAALDIHIPVCGMVKDDRHRTRGLLYEGEEVALPYASEGFKLVTRIQDEVHRFAIEYHRKLRADAQVKSVLDEIPGIGPSRRKELIKKFKSLDAVREADVETLAKVKGMNQRAAEAVKGFFEAQGKGNKE
ncbi:MAG: excinuclease ABC subunit UvrC [Defluviitaleaceae bacterium]|nr:excinuclease ABC subunit UvrC [Defluviitaleaceae bacterium]